MFFARGNFFDMEKVDGNNFVQVFLDTEEQNAYQGSRLQKSSSRSGLNSIDHCNLDVASAIRAHDPRRRCIRRKRSSGAPDPCHKKGRWSTALVIDLQMHVRFIPFFGHTLPVPRTFSFFSARHHSRTARWHNETSTDYSNIQPRGCLAESDCIRHCPGERASRTLFRAAKIIFLVEADASSCELVTQHRHPASRDHLSPMRGLMNRRQAWKT